MTNKEVFEKFKSIYPVEESEMECWFPNGKNSVRVRTKSYGDLIFTYKNKKTWKIESVDSFLESIKVRAK